MTFRYLFVLSLASVLTWGCASSRPVSHAIQTECSSADCTTVATATPWPAGTAGSYTLKVQPFVEMMLVAAPVGTTKIGDSTVLQFTNERRLVVAEMYRDDFPELGGTDVGIPELMAHVFEGSLQADHSIEQQPGVRHVVISLKQGFALSETVSITAASQDVLRAYRLIRRQPNREKIVLTSTEHPEVAVVLELDGFTNTAIEAMIGTIQAH